MIYFTVYAYQRFRKTNQQKAININVVQFPECIHSVLSLCGLKSGISWMPLPFPEALLTNIQRYPHAVDNTHYVKTQTEELEVNLCTVTAYIKRFMYIYWRNT